MIQILVETVRVPSSSSISDLGKAMQAQAANAGAQGFADHLKNAGVGSKNCEHHPDHTSTVVVKALDTREMIRVVKRGFCCREFENSIQITVK